jgi:hypothetical protein
MVPILQVNLVYRVPWAANSEFDPGLSGLRA